MNIYLKPIKNKVNEWQPQLRHYFHAVVVAEIIKKEDLLENGYCITNVAFNSDTQTFTNVELECKDYHDEFIYLVKSDEFRDYEYVWAYVTKKTYNTKQRVVLDLTVDPLTTNYHIFGDNQFQGLAYTERATNIVREVNNIHPDSCSGLENKVYQEIETDLPINKNVDMFISTESNVISKDFKISYGIGPPFAPPTRVENLGTIYSYNNTPTHQRLISYTSIFNNFKDVMSLEGDNYTETMFDIFKKYDLNFDSNTWRMKWDDYLLFIAELQKNYVEMPMFANLHKIISDKDINKWLTIPRFFKGLTDTVIADFEFSVDFLIPYLDLTNHVNLHNQYFIIVGKTFQFEVDLLQIVDKQQPKIYGTRIVNMDNTKFLFYYAPERQTSFYDLTLDINNAVLSKEYLDKVDALNNSYNSGMKGALLDTLFPFLSLSITSLFGLSFGKRWAAFNLITGGTNLGFSLFKNALSGKYNDQTKQELTKQTDNVLLYEALNSIMLDKTNELQFGKLSINPDGPDNLKTIQYFLRRGTVLNSDVNFEYVELQIKKLLPDDEKTVYADQKEYGNIVNLLDTYDNILDYDFDNDIHMYYQGAIQPTINPVSSFMLQVLNNTLQQGVKIFSTQDIEMYIEKALLRLYLKYRGINKDKAYAAMTAEFVGSYLTPRTRAYFQPEAFTFIGIFDANDAEISDEDFKILQSKDWKLKYTYKDNEPKIMIINITSEVSDLSMTFEIANVMYQLTFTGGRDKQLQEVYDLITEDFIKEQLPEEFKPFYDHEKFGLLDITIKADYSSIPYVLHQRDLYNNLQIYPAKINFTYGTETSAEYDADFTRNLTLKIEPTTQLLAEQIALLSSTLASIKFYEEDNHTLQDLTDTFEPSLFLPWINEVYAEKFDESKYTPPPPTWFRKPNGNILILTDTENCTGEDLRVTGDIVYDGITANTSIKIIVCLKDQDVINFINTMRIDFEVKAGQLTEDFRVMYFKLEQMESYISDAKTSYSLRNNNLGFISLDRWNSVSKTYENLEPNIPISNVNTKDIYLRWNYWYRVPDQINQWVLKDPPEDKNG